MTRLLHLDPKAKTVAPVEADDPNALARKLAGGGVDHGTVYRNPERGIGIIVYEYGLVEGNGPYFELMGVLYSGHAILFGFDEGGETIDMPEKEDFLITPLWLADKGEVELAIAAGLVQRPETRVNGALIWSWS